MEDTEGAFMHCQMKAHAKAAARQVLHAAVACAFKAWHRSEWLD